VLRSHLLRLPDPPLQLLQEVVELAQALVLHVDLL